MGCTQRGKHAQRETNWTQQIRGCRPAPTNARPASVEQLRGHQRQRGRRRAPHTHAQGRSGRGGAYCTAALVTVITAKRRRPFARPCQTHMRSSWFVMKYSPVGERFSTNDSANCRALDSGPAAPPKPSPPPPLLQLLGAAAWCMPLLPGPIASGAPSPVAGAPSHIVPGPPRPLLLAVPASTLPSTCTSIVPSCGCVAEVQM